MVSPDINEEGLRVLGRMECELDPLATVRRGPTADPLDLNAYDRWLNEELAKLDRLLPACEKYGLLSH